MAYNASNISVLEGLDPVRKRPGMYVGSTSVKGLNHLVYEILDNSVDEHLAGYCNNITVDSAFVFDEITEESVNALSSDKMDQLSGWLACGGDVTLHSLKELKHKDPELVEEMIHFCAEAPLYESVTVGSKDYLLVHSGLGNFSIEKSIESYTTDELLWTRPKLEDRYFDDVKTIIGHTPTQYYGFKYYGRALKTATWINIDTSAAYEGHPMLLRLDDLKEFYI